MSRMQVAKNEDGRFEVGFIGRDGVLSFEPGSITFATKGEAAAEMRHMQMQAGREAAAERSYASQIAHACGERD